MERTKPDRLLFGDVAMHLAGVFVGSFWGRTPGIPFAMADSDHSQDKTAGESGDRIQETLDHVVKESSPKMPGQDQQTKIDRGSGDKIDREIDHVVKESGPKAREHWDRGPTQAG
jgi:hypothetical protein